ncbi:uncharacterized protein [Rutidosis leptorrhynchoides]|uniref:uncharacterized protein n=1 Tax=Rutidosis leptorrhynchoides TaxID=125765 RepID=UPI003A996AB8
MWSLWNPVSLKMICLPRLILKKGDGKSIEECLLTAPPDDPASILLLTRHDASTFVFCLLNGKRKTMKWAEISYAKQLKRLSSECEFIHSLTCCNGTIYALSYDDCSDTIVLQVEIVVKEGKVMIKLPRFGEGPETYCRRYGKRFDLVKGYGKELFYIKVSYLKNTKKIEEVSLFSLDTTGIDLEELEGITQEMWEQVTDLKDSVFYADLGPDGSVFYNPAVASELGGYIHIRVEEEEILYSYRVKYRTIVPSVMPSRVVLTTYVLMWEGRLEDDHVEEVKCIATFKQVNNVSCLHNIPFDFLKMIMEFCVGVEYLNFLATCKLCREAAPSIQWSNESSLKST